LPGNEQAGKVYGQLLFWYSADIVKIIYEFYAEMTSVPLRRINALLYM